nr:O-antigen polysaccharide polymerase Wzy [Saccharopolyspora sp. HNM0983]
MGAFAAVAGLRRAPAPVGPVEPGQRERRALATVGLGLQLAGTAQFLAAVPGLGSGLLAGGNYQDYVAANQSNGGLGYGYLLLALGPVLAVAAGGRARSWSWALFGAFAVLALAIGNRGEVLFPLVALLVVEARRGRRVPRSWLWPGAAAVLVLITLVRQFRGQLGVSAASPLDAVAEMGFSLRPTTMVLGWHAAGEPFRGGITFIGVPVRALEKLFGAPPDAESYDDRLFNVEIMERVGPIGGSPVAEGYHNFGVLGPVLVLMVIALLVTVAERGAGRVFADARLGVVLVPLLENVRNSAASVAVHIGIGVLLLAAVHAWVGLRGGPAARPPDHPLTGVVGTR